MHFGGGLLLYLLDATKSFPSKATGASVFQKKDVTKRADGRRGGEIWKQ